MFNGFNWEIQLQKSVTGGNGISLMQKYDGMVPESYDMETVCHVTVQPLKEAPHSLQAVSQWLRMTWQAICKTLVHMWSCSTQNFCLDCGVGQIALTLI